MQYACVPQGSILGPLLFLIYTNDIINDIESDIQMFADDTSLLEIICDTFESYSRVNRDLAKLVSWSKKWLMNFNPSKTKSIIFSKKTENIYFPPLVMDGKIIKRVNSLKQIGLTLTRNMTWDSHIENKHTKAMKKVTLLKLLPPNIPRNTRRQIYISFIRPLIEYANVIIDNCSEKAEEMLEKIQRQAALAITRAYKHTKHTDLLKHTGLTSLKQRRHNSKLTLIYKIRKISLPNT